MIGSGMVCQALPYHEGFGAKQIAWLVHSAVVGSVVAPLTLLGGPLMIRAACYTAGVVGGNVYCFQTLCLNILSCLLPDAGLWDCKNKPASFSSQMLTK